MNICHAPNQLIHKWLYLGPQTFVQCEQVVIMFSLENASSLQVNVQTFLKYTQIHTHTHTDAQTHTEIYIYSHTGIHFLQSTHANLLFSQSTESASQLFSQSTKECKLTILAIDRTLQSDYFKKLTEYCLNIHNKKKMKTSLTILTINNKKLQFFYSHNIYKLGGNCSC